MKTLRKAFGRASQEPTAGVQNDTPAADGLGEEDDYVEVSKEKLPASEVWSDKSFDGLKYIKSIEDNWQVIAANNASNKARVEKVQSTVKELEKVQQEREGEAIKCFEAMKQLGDIKNSIQNAGAELARVCKGAERLRELHLSLVEAQEYKERRKILESLEVDRLEYQREKFSELAALETRLAEESANANADDLSPKKHEQSVAATTSATAHEGNAAGPTTLAEVDIGEEELETSKDELDAFYADVEE